MVIEDQVGKFIGPKKITSVSPIGQMTPGGFELWEIGFKDDTAERFSAPMLKHVIRKKSIDISELRDKRIAPVVEVTLQVLRDWGIKMSELQFYSAMLQNSLDYNYNQAQNILLSEWMPKPISPDEVDLLVIDRILRSKAKKDS